MSSPPLVVLHVASGDLWAGAEVQLYHLAVALKCLPECTVHVALFNEGELAQRLRAAGISTFVFPEREFSGPRLLLMLIKLMRKLRPSIVHTHRQKENVLGVIAALLAGRIPSIRTVHGSGEIRPKVWQIHKWLFRLLDVVVGRFLQKRIVAVSAELASRLTLTFPITMLSIIDNGINTREVLDSSRSSCAPFAHLPERIHVGFVGRLVPVKRPDIFLQTAALLEQTRPNMYSFWLFGDGPLMDEMRLRVTALQLESCVHLMGFVRNAPACLKEMDLLLITSEHEGLPINLLEAMSLSIPVIAHAVGGIPHVLGDGIYGTLVQSLDANEFAVAIEQFARDPLSFLCMADRAQERVTREYSSQSTAYRYIDVYRKHLN